MRDAKAQAFTPLAVTAEVVAVHGLSSEEYQKIIDILGREPNYSELGVFSVMWSEHCSYKSSRRYLKLLPTQGPHVLQGPGENAGVVDIGDGLAAVFKMESHNHPSFIEPYQGAATGVGGILRDIFTMGARHIASLNSLRFGSIDHPRTRYLLSGVVAGIGGYGNCIGVPTVGGEVGLIDDRGAAFHSGAGQGFVGRVVAEDLDQAGLALMLSLEVAELVLLAVPGGERRLLVTLVGGDPLQLVVAGRSPRAGALGLHALAPGGEVALEVGDQVAR